MRFVFAVLLFLLAGNAHGQALTDSDIEQLAVQCEKRSKGVDFGNGIVMKGYLADGRTLIYQYDVSEGWESFDGMKQEIITNNISAGMADLFYSGNIDVEYQYFRGNSLLERIEIRSKEFSVFGDDLGEYLSIEGHPKAKSVNLKLRIPFGWDVKEGDRPNVVKKFVYGDNTYLVLVKDLPTFYSKRESAVLLQEPEVVEALLEEWEKVFDSPIIESKKIVTVDNYPALEIQMKGSAERMGLTFNLAVRMWMVVYEDKMIHLMGSSSGDINDEVLQALFFRITNSVVFPEQYN